MGVFRQTKMFILFIQQQNLNMKSTKQLNKRSFSPLISKNIDISDKKKKSTSNYPSNPYRQSKEFDSHLKTDKKRSSNYLKDILRQPESSNKYRIVTEPVDDRIMSIVSSSFLPSKSKGKIETEHSAGKTRQISQQRRGQSNNYCANCQKYVQELAAIKHEINKMITSKILWKNGQISLQNLKQEYGLFNKHSKHSQQGIFMKSIESSLNQAKKHFYDLMKDIESLTEIDYPKMLALKVFKYEPLLENPKITEEGEIKQLLSQLRNHYEGKINAWDLEEEIEESDHVKAIMRNLKSRLSHYLRENLELRTKKAILEKAEEISQESQEYLRQIVEDVLYTYTAKI